MKNLSKLVLSIGLIAGVSAVSNAQESFGNAGLEIALPIGDFSDGYGIGIGGSGGYEFGISDNIAITGTVGITFLSVKDELSDVIKSSYLLPIQVGGRYYLSESREGLFGELMLGMHLFSVATEDIEITGLPTIEGESESEAYFSLAPQVGYFINENLSVALRYQMIFQSEQEETVTVGGFTQTITTEASTLGYIGVKLAYNF